MQYLPPIVPENSSWTSNIGDGEEGQCGNSFHHGQSTSKSEIGAEYAASAARGLQVLSYFNLFEYGQNFVCEDVPPQTPPPPNDWQNSTQFLANHMPGSVMPGCPNTGWQNGVVLDPGVPSFAAFILSQVELKLASFGSSFQGLAIDRFDHASTWRHGLLPPLDDGLAWCGDPCYPLLTGFISLLGKVGGLLWETQPSPSLRISTANYVGTQRLDTLQFSDGVFSEDYSRHLTLLYSSGFSTTGKPPNMIWTYDSENAAGVLNYRPNPDAYFSQHIAMKAFPFAPVIGADHSLLPHPDTPLQGYFSSWEPLFTALRGGCWWLDANPVLAKLIDAPNSTLFTNGFTVGGGCTSPGVNAGNGAVRSVLAYAYNPTFASLPGDTAFISLATMPFLNLTQGPTMCEAVQPGGAWASLTLPTLNATSGRWELQAGMLRGAVLIRCTQ